MYYAFSVFKRYCCPTRSTGDSTTELAETVTAPPAAEPSTPKPPPSSPVIAPVATTTYPDLPTLNPSLVRKDDDDTYTV